MSGKFNETSTGINVLRSFFGEGGMEEEEKEDPKNANFSQPPGRINYYYGNYSPYLNLICSQGENSHIQLSLNDDISLNDAQLDIEIDYEIEKEEEAERERKKERKKNGGYGKNKRRSRKKK